MNSNASGRANELEAPPFRMLPSRSARLAATLLIALLFGWVVRTYRKGGTSTIPVPSPALAAPKNEPSANTFPDE
ncbi:hypothetical protein [Prosthecobacter sp.]|uniref:hypothetical protein n=1 Tax=Prosthecobacter sp. TaxID=1965333 RepID=UPI001E0A6C2E|nr:hypothetical protein [Prosthecobacter sp.]MCB1275601.1 hypothetical protein [Prosthecobacter sp.]